MPRPRIEPSPHQPAADATRAALVRAALGLFGRQGFDGTSTRQIAAAAGANIGSIAYHFGGKEGLRMAVAEHIVETVRAITSRAVGDPAGLPEDARTPQAARALLAAAVERVVAFLVARPEAGEIVQFLLRELSHPSPAIDRIYAGVFEPTHKRLCAIWELATGEPAESEATRLCVFSLIGQVVYFRIAREAVMRRMGWQAIGAAEADKVAAVVTGNLEAMLAARTSGAVP
jgi:AcrR family transcriptional regulator